MSRYLLAPLFGLLLLLAAACQKDTPEPAPPPSEAYATYTDEKGVTTSITHFGGTLAYTLDPNGGRYRTVFLRAWLPDRTFIEVAFFVDNLTFPTATGPATLDHLNVTHGGGSMGSHATVVYPAVSTSQLTVDRLSPQTVSGTYTGPLQNIGPEVKLVFHKVDITNPYTYEPQ
jgi:hypothetical protein